MRRVPRTPPRGAASALRGVELRALPRDTAAGAADAFAALGPWEGETPEGIRALASEARKASRPHAVPAL